MKHFQINEHLRCRECGEVGRLISRMGSILVTCNGRGSNPLTGVCCETRPHGTREEAEAQWAAMHVSPAKRTAGTRALAPTEKEEGDEEEDD